MDRESGVANVRGEAIGRCGENFGRSGLVVLGFVCGADDGAFGWRGWLGGLLGGWVGGRRVVVDGLADGTLCCFFSCCWRYHDP